MSAACRSHEATDGRSWHYEAHIWLSLGIKVSLLLTGFAFARTAWPSRLGRIVLSGALVLLVAGIVTFVLHDSFTGYKGLEERLWAFVAQAWALVCATVLILEATLEGRRPGGTRGFHAATCAGRARRRRPRPGVVRAYSSGRQGLSLSMVSKF